MRLYMSLNNELFPPRQSPACVTVVRNRSNSCSLLISCHIENLVNSDIPISLFYLFSEPMRLNFCKTTTVLFRMVIAIAARGPENNRVTVRAGWIKTLITQSHILLLYIYWNPWWRHQMETFSALLAICSGNSPVPGAWVNVDLDLCRHTTWLDDNELFHETIEHYLQWCDCPQVLMERGSTGIRPWYVIESIV